ncbi:MAG: FtsW/RodA/SpoVE family cell cycle protein [Oscillospiraceae bacterium]|nr:FtsW/RodA/SpoVE family cell cycle protein [Oscillospiraceae bacterium]
MRDFIQELKKFFRKGDMLLLMLCLATSAFGTLIIASVTNAPKFGSSTRYIAVQIGATLIGVVFYAIMSSIDTDVFSEHRRTLMIISALLLLALVPFGTDNNTGNKSWIEIPIIHINIQPAEICKILYILITASIMASHQNRASAPLSVLHVTTYLVVFFMGNWLISSDLGVSLIFGGIFFGMVVAGGINWGWILAGLGLLATGGPFVLYNFFSEEQRNRILYVFMPEVIDPEGLDEGWHTTQSLKSLTGGGFSGQGLFNGNRTQSGSLFAQHTDYIFSSIGEELGFVGCMLVVGLLLLIIIRCIWVGVHSKDYMRRLVCFGAASAMIFQVFCNVGMCLGVTPVIGLTLPFFSYGGSSIVTTYAMLGLVSGVHARPSPRSHERYIRPPFYY